MVRDRVVVVAITAAETRVWLLHDEDHAPLFTVGHDALGAKHRRAVTESRANAGAHDDDPYFAAIAERISTASHVVLVGHGSGGSNLSSRFADWLGVHDPSLLSRVEATRHLDLPAMTDAQIVADARRAWFAR